MTTPARIAIPHCPPFVINSSGTGVFNSKTRKRASRLSIEEAAAHWNRFARGGNLRGDVEGAGTSATRIGRPVARAAELVRDGKVAVLWIDRSPASTSVEGLLEPASEIPLIGDPDQDWFLLRMDRQFHCLFHGPSVAARLHQKSRDRHPAHNRQPQ